MWTTCRVVPFCFSMKKIILLLILVLLSGCSAWKQVKQENTSELTGNFKKAFKLEKIENPYHVPISSTGDYSLDCKSLYYQGIHADFEGIYSGVISKSHERFVIYVNDETAKYAGGDYAVLQDDKNYLVLARFYKPSGLNETITVNKKTGLMIDNKVKGFGITGDYPDSTTYLFSCELI